jgi:hypothetical protein
VNLAKQIKKRIKFLVENELYSHIIAFAYFCDRQAREHANTAWAAVDAAWAAADWATDATLVADRADAAATRADAAAARRKQLEFLEWIWATSKHYWQTKKFKKVGGIVL